MKKYFAIAAVLVLMIVGTAMATPKYVAVTPVLEGNEVVIPALPAGATLVNVEIYDDVRGIPARQLGAKNRFALEPGAGFNFEWKDADGTWYQMITPKSKAGKGLAIDCADFGNGKVECKYLRPAK